MTKKDNTLMWVAGLGLGVYLYSKYKNGSLVIPGLPAPTNTVPGASSGTLLLPPAVASLNVAPVNNAPSANAVNVTNLVPAAVSPSGIPIINPGQSMALNANSTPVTNSAGVPMLFTTAVVKPSYLSLINGGPEYGGGECL